MDKKKHKEYMSKNRAWIIEAMKTALEISTHLYPTDYEQWVSKVTTNELRMRAISYYGKYAIEYEEYRAFLGMFERS